MVIKEQNILKAMRNAGVEHEVNETMIRAAIEREGIDFGRSVHCRGDAPNREWTNVPAEFEPSEEERASELKRRKAVAEAERAAKLEEEVERTLAAREIASLKAQLAAALSPKDVQDGSTYSAPPLGKSNKQPTPPIPGQ